MELFNKQSRKVSLIERLRATVLCDESRCSNFMHLYSQDDVADIVNDISDFDDITTIKETRYGGEGQGTTYYSIIKFESGGEEVRN